MKTLKNLLTPNGRGELKTTVENGNIFVTNTHLEGVFAINNPISGEWIISTDPEKELIVIEESQLLKEVL